MTAYQEQGRARQEVLPPGESTRIRKFIVEYVVPEVGPMLRQTFDEHERARAEKRTSSLLIGQKQAGTFETTTDADLHVDALIQKRLAQAFPSIRYLSEDALQGEPVTPEELKQLPALWIVDSVDGTGRFAGYSPRFSTSLALVSFGEPVVGVVHKATSDRTWWAEADEEGAFVDGRPIEVSETESLDKATISTAYAWDKEKRSKNMHILHNRLSAHVHQPAVNTASSVLDLIEVANGRTDGHFSVGLKAWDMAAAAFDIVKAGGRVTTLTGGKWDPFCGEILATNGRIHDDLLNLINEGKGFSINKVRRAGLLFSSALHMVRDRMKIVHQGQL